ncbi:DMT family transporter [Pseudooctadecabacter jejudonensis]|uniref:Riboflavin transporter n=1 Tax=Pseudooctadecabacter jejudonensis TaxID=1391910 RepID=A0A1Y5RP70_9RHOB|nr:DMT family transporter [Pseudooctadecabacter jejudonensis]SLN20951.1 Riboflavin transporter [Pseudooctadecabacter jejudonensis]
MTDRPFLGVLLMLGFCVLAPLGDATAKVLGDEMSVGFLVFIRFSVQALLLLPLVWFVGYPLPKGARLIRLTALRTALHICGIGLMFSALQYLPLADAIAIAFVMPFLMLLLGRVFLDEEVGPQRLAACAVGFIGTLLVVQPNFATVGWPALLPMGVAVVFALFMLVTRQIAKDVDPIGLQALSGLMAVPLVGAALLLFPQVPILAVSPVSGGDWILLAWLGTLGTLAHLLMTWSLRFAPSATLAPMQYLEIPIGTIIGYLVFRDLPNGLAALGICITIAAGLYIIVRERRLSTRPKPTPTPPAA